MMFCKYIKLTSGENIIVNTDDTCDTLRGKEFIEVLNPVQVGSMRFPRMGYVVESHVFMPWIAVSSSKKIKIPTQSIVVVVDVNDLVARQYDEYVNNGGSDPSFEESEDDMTMEEFLAADAEESDQEDDDNSSYDGRTLH